jgi:photosystem II stability/assembly factor-like uncharacterized protein
MPVNETPGAELTRTTFPLCAAAVAGLTLLTACGGDGADPDAGRIEGARTARPSPGRSPETSRPPETVFPGNAKNVFEGQRTGDSKKDAVLADNAQRINSIDDAIFRGRSHTPALAFYSKGAALQSARAFVRRWTDDGETWVGTARYFAREVSFQPDGTAAVVYCCDESKAFIKSDAGTVDRGPATSDAYVLYNTRLARSPEGVWQTVSVLSQRGAAQCQQ